MRITDGGPTERRPRQNLRTQPTTNHRPTNKAPTEAGAAAYPDGGSDAASRKRPRKTTGRRRTKSPPGKKAGIWSDATIGSERPPPGQAAAPASTRAQSKNPCSPKGPQGFAPTQKGRKTYASACTIGGARLIFPAEMHRVHTRTRRRSPFSSTILTVWRFGNHRRFVLLWAWLTLLPVAGPFPHTLHTRAISIVSCVLFVS